MDRPRADSIAVDPPRDVRDPCRVVAFERVIRVERFLAVDDLRPADRRIVTAREAGVPTAAAGRTLIGLGDVDGMVRSRPLARLVDEDDAELPVPQPVDRSIPVGRSGCGVAFRDSLAVDVPDDGVEGGVAAEELRRHRYGLPRRRFVRPHEGNRRLVAGLHLDVQRVLAAPPLVVGDRERHLVSPQFGRLERRRDVRRVRRLDRRTVRGPDRPPVINDLTVGGVRPAAVEVDRRPLSHFLVESGVRQRGLVRRQRGRRRGERDCDQHHEQDD